MQKHIQTLPARLSPLNLSLSSGIYGLFDTLWQSAAMQRHI